MTLFEILSQQAQKHGFPLSGAVDLDLALQAEKSAFPQHVQRYDSWLGQALEGEMSYLRRGRDRRADPKLVFSETLSVFSVALPYWRQPLGDESHGPRYARYLKGRDYHEDMAERLESVMQATSVAAKRDFPELRWKVCVDTSAILERSWAVLAGLGWIGKNTTLINPKYGSYLFLGEVLINQKLGLAPKPLPNYCGNCTRCLDSCPTDAFTPTGALDSRRCISYWTLEKRGELAISENDKRKIGTWIAGCDICQEVCPFNIKPARQKIQAPAEQLGEFRDATTLDAWMDLLQESAEQYRARVRSSALSRVKPAQFSRNLAIAFTNFLLSSTLTEQELSRYRQAVAARVSTETDSVALLEWQKAAQSLEPKRSP